MIDNEKDMAIQLLIEGKLSKVAIAKKVGRSRQWLYESVINDTLCMAEVDRRLQIVQTQGMNTIKANLDSNIQNIIYLSKNADSEKIRADCSMYLIDRCLGKTTTHLEIKAEPVLDTVDKKELLEDFEQFNDVIDVDVITE